MKIIRPIIHGIGEGGAVDFFLQFLSEHRAFLYCHQVFLWLSACLFGFFSGLFSYGCSVCFILISLEFFLRINMFPPIFAVWVYFVVSIIFFLLLRTVLVVLVLHACCICWHTSSFIDFRTVWDVWSFVNSCYLVCSSGFFHLEVLALCLVSFNDWFFPDIMLNEKNLLICI